MARKELGNNKLTEEKKFPFISGIDRFVSLWLAEEFVKRML